MSNYYHLPIVGIDVAANFSIVTALKPNGEIYHKNLRITHTLEGFTKLLLFLKKIEEEFNDKPKVFCESTGIYHLTLLHFLIDHQIDLRVINPLITNSNKNFNIRKVKNDKLDSLSIARLCKNTEIKTSMFTSKEFLYLKFLVRDYYKIIDLRANLKKNFSNNLYIYYPGLQDAFSDVTGKTSLAFIKAYPTPIDLLHANSDDVINFLKSCSRKGLQWANKKYNKLVKIAQSAQIIGINSSQFKSKVARFSETYDFYSVQLDNLMSEIHQYIDTSSFADEFNQNISLLLSFKGLGTISAIALLTEMGNINNFSNSNQLVAFFGVDPGVNQSGKFKGDKNKMSKRGTAIGRRALYVLALNSIKKNRNGKPINLVLYEFYNINLGNKKKKVRLVAVMNKLLRYIFSVLKNQKPYEPRDPKAHKRIFMDTKQTLKLVS